MTKKDTLYESSQYTETDSSSGRTFLLFQDKASHVIRVSDHFLRQWWTTASTRANRLLKLSNTHVHTSATKKANQSQAELWTGGLRALW